MLKYFRYDFNTETIEYAPEARRFKIHFFWIKEFLKLDYFMLFCDIQLTFENNGSIHFFGLISLPWKCLQFLNWFSMRIKKDIGNYICAKTSKSRSYVNIVDWAFTIFNLNCMKRIFLGIAIVSLTDVACLWTTK